MAAESIFTIILDKLITSAIQQLGVASDTEEKLKKLERIFKKIQSVIVDAERQTANTNVKIWLLDLQDLAHKADDLLKDFEFEAQKGPLNYDSLIRKVLYYCFFCKPIMTHFSLCRRLNDIIEKLEKIAAEIQMFNFRLNNRLLERCPVSTTDRLNAGETLGPGQSLVQGAYLFIMQQDCNLVLYDDSEAVWASGTNGRASGCSVTMQSDGNLVIYSGGTAIWASNTYRQNGNYYLILQRDRNVVIYDDSNNAIWATGTNAMASATDRLNAGETLGPGQSLAQGAYLFIMQKDCNLVLYDNNRAVWASETNGRASGCSVTMQSDGNLVIYSGGTAIWASNTYRQNGNYYLILQRDRNVVIYDDSNNPIWATGTNVGNAL